MSHDAFISYSVLDKPVADAACATLEASGIRCWIAPRDILPGMDRGEAIIDAINSSRVVILVFSSHANTSPEIKREVERAVSKGIAILPFRIENVPLSKSLEYFISVPHWLDALTPPLEKHLTVLAEKASMLLSVPLSGALRKSPPEIKKKDELQIGKLVRYVGGAALILGIVLGAIIYFVYRSFNPGLDFKRSSFVVATVDQNGIVKGRLHQEANAFVEDLGNGIQLEMIQIPGDTFWMGTSAQESQQVRQEFNRIGVSQDNINYMTNSEMPQGQVKVVGFYMSKFEITQAQWKQIVAVEKISTDLESTPSFFNGDNRPVEQVSWRETIEFCDRLAEKTKRPYRLPSEAEWEYSCRAGTTTPFHFGETITPEVVNFNGNFPWGLAPAGLYRQQTTEVGSTSVANAFGLFDMHGNVFELCMDPWHATYQGSPSGARVWEEGGDTRYRVIRGGSYLSAAAFCRSAYRSWSGPDVKSTNVGFRVALFYKE